MSLGHNGSDKLNQGVPILINILKGQDVKSLSQEVGVSTARIYEIARDTAYRVLPLVVGRAGHALCDLPQASFTFSVFKQDQGLCAQMLEYLVDMVDPFDNLVPSACFPAMAKLGVYNKSDFLRLCEVGTTIHAKQQMAYVISRREAMAVQRCMEGYIKSKLEVSTDAMDRLKAALIDAKKTMSLDEALEFVRAVYKD